MRIFELKNAVLGYGDKEVLHINKLTIEQGKLIVFFGESGIGKSTLLEALGLMNETILKGSITLFPMTDNEYVYPIKWNNSNDKEISNYRKLHFSFIFQETNLMPNFSIEENIAVTKIIQNGNKVDNNEELDKKLSELGLDKIDKNDSHLTLSGGQKQRVAFVRATLPSFTVLFGDEPTGSLDDSKANYLMQKLKSLVNDGKKCVIIVTHNIELSLKYADHIVLLGKEHDGKACITNEFNKADSLSWFDKNNNKLSNDIVKANLIPSQNNINGTGNGVKTSKKSNIKSLISNNLAKIIFCGTSTNPRLKEIFFNNEFKALLGKRMSIKESRVSWKYFTKYQNLFFNIFLFALTCFIISFSGNSISILKRNLDNPFNNWVNVVIPRKMQNNPNILLDTLKAYKSDIQLDTIEGYNTFHYLFRSNNNIDNYVRGITLINNGVLYNSIFSEDNDFIGRKFNNDQDIGVVITYDFLDKLGYAKNIKPDFIKMSKTSVDNDLEKTFIINVPVIALVSKLPSSALFGVTPYFYQNRELSESFPFNGNRFKLHIITNDRDKAYTLRNEIEEKVSEFSEIRRISSTADIDPLTDKTGYSISVMLDDDYDPVNVERIYSQLISKLPNFKNEKIYCIPADYNLKSEFPQIKYTQYGLVLSRLDSINRLENILAKQEIEIDMREIKSKENFNIISKMTFFISIFLLFFSLLCVTLFSGNIISHYLDSLKQSIGTLKAFGLSNKILIIIYQRIFITFLLLSIFSGLLLSWLLSSMFFDLNFWSNYLYLLSFVFLIIFFNVVYFRLQGKKILIETPGNLIYCRT